MPSVGMELTAAGDTPLALVAAGAAPEDISEEAFAAHATLTAGTVLPPSDPDPEGAAAVQELMGADLARCRRG